MEVDEGSNQKSDIQPHWMAADARLKKVFTEDEKYHNLMSWLNYFEFLTPLTGTIAMILSFRTDRPGQIRLIRVYTVCHSL